MQFEYKDQIKLIVSDVDGTLVNEERHITARTVAAIEAAQASGCEVAIASGRAWNEMTEIRHKIPAISYFICSNGAYVYDGHREKVLFQTGFGIEEALQILKDIEQFDVYVEVYLAGQVYSDEYFKNHLAEFIMPSLNELFLESRKYIPNFYGYIKEQNIPLEKIQVFYGTEEKKEAVLNFFKEADFEVITSSEGNLEFVPPGISKGASVKKLAELKGLTAAEVMTLGDSNNDLTMLRYAGASFAMANSMATAKAAAKFITASNKEDGVAQAVEWMLANNKKLSTGKRFFQIDDTCVKCGACAVECPVQTIRQGTEKFIIGSQCIGCGDCYAICPVGAVKKILT